ncbi:MAG: hypothetical protein JOS17DRAFT_796168 [Linnemannia elongata]|nr:MAG: hypothetical protein JOS17DRAFT_796168 [Linnemannia elongata]
MLFSGIGAHLLLASEYLDVVQPRLGGIGGACPAALVLMDPSLFGGSKMWACLPSVSAEHLAFCWREVAPKSNCTQCLWSIHLSLRGSLSDGSRPGTPLSGDLHADVKRITDKFFAPGPNVDFLGAFVKGEGALPITSGSMHGLPRAWRRGFGVAPENRPSLLFMDLPDPSTPDLPSKNLANGSSLELVKENNRYHMPSLVSLAVEDTRVILWN